MECLPVFQRGLHLWMEQYLSKMEVKILLSIVNSLSIPERFCPPESPFQRHFFSKQWGGNARSIKLSNLPNASGALANSTMRTVGQVDVRIKLSNINFFFEGQALVLENLSLPVILGVNFLKTNSLSPILEPDMAQLVHTSSQQAQMLVGNVSSGNLKKNKSPSRSRPKTHQKRSNRSQISPPCKFRKPPPS